MSDKWNGLDNYISDLRKKYRNKIKKIINSLINKKITLSVAESCTGGMLAQNITSISGASNVFNFGIITYSNQSKIKFLKVPSKLISKYGSVSHECCLSMVKNLSKISEEWKPFRSIAAWYLWQ